MGRLVATGKLASVGEAMNFKVDTKEDIVALGLDRGTELVLLQLLTMQQGLDERLVEIESRLSAIEKGKKREEIGDSSDGDDRYDNWSGWGS